MALNFPPVNAADGNPTNGMIWTAPSGHQWLYDETVPGWKSLAPTGNSNIVYRGGIDLTRNPNSQYTDIASGNQFVVTVGADPVNGTLYPGLDGEAIAEGQIVVYDGNEWQYIINVPYATETAPGIVELADESEAVDETNHRVVLTPMRGGELIDFKIPQAETTVVGKTRYATRTEAEAGVEFAAALTPYSIQNLINRLEDLEAELYEDVGMIQWFAGRGNNIPPGFLYCDGRRIYQTGVTTRLYSKLRDWGNPWGPSAGSTTVRIPDLRGRFIRGYDDGAGRDPSRTGFGGAQDDSFEEHRHGAFDNGHRHEMTGYELGNSSARDDMRLIMSNNWKNPSDRWTSRMGDADITIQLEGGNETRPKNINLTPVIKL